MFRGISFLLFLGCGFPASAQDSSRPNGFDQSVQELRHSIGSWETTTRFLNPDGSTARTVVGTYEFEWIVPDRVVTGRTENPELSQASGILFYVSEAKRRIEMVSVGADGNLWVMTGPLGGDERLSQEYQASEGTKARLRFTRFNVLPESFESRMEYTQDDGTTWTPGNHQTFRRLSN